MGSLGFPWQTSSGTNASGTFVPMVGEIFCCSTCGKGTSWRCGHFSLSVAMCWWRNGRLSSFTDHTPFSWSLCSCSSMRDSTVRSSFSFLKLVVIAYGWEDQTVWSTIKSQATDKWRVYKSYVGSRVQQGKGSNRRPITINYSQW